MVILSFEFLFFFQGPFVHMGAIVATCSRRSHPPASIRRFSATKVCLKKGEEEKDLKIVFFSGREMEMLSSGCAVGIACTFSAPIGGRLFPHGQLIDHEKRK